uniref:Uncharacterized protein n=1 Tax=Plectus sambesii TaxID=2011161 RepID=A0A914UTL4_9BILA
MLRLFRKRLKLTNNSCKRSAGGRDRSGAVVASTTDRPPTTPSPSSSTSQSAPSTSHLATAAPFSTLSEWQLFAVLQRANLLQYYHTFIEKGGDDINQLLDAHEDEFLEIMSLVSMAHKPLHVRRLQKVLQEYSQNPGRFNMLSVQRLGPPPGGGPLIQDLGSPASNSALPFVGVFPGVAPTIDVVRPTVPSDSSPSHLQQWPLSLTAPGATANVLPGAFIPVSLLPQSPTDYDQSCPGTSSDPGGYISSGTPNPTLTEGQIKKIAECAAAIVAKIPQYEPKLVQNKKKVSKELLNVMSLAEDSPMRLDEFRRYSAIYGRFDAKRKADKPLSLHEVSVNEAAAQICVLRPALLTRRDELFPLARQVVKDAGYNYAKGNKKSSSDADREGRKRATPADSVASDDRSRSPSSSTAGSPPLGDVSEFSSAADVAKRRRRSSPTPQSDAIAALREKLRSTTEPTELEAIRNRLSELSETSSYDPEWTAAVVKEEPSDSSGDDERA